MTSPSTLIRKAAKSKSPDTAKKLRAQAAALRRALRAKAKKKARRADPRAINPNRTIKSLAREAQQAGEAIVMTRTLGGAGGEVLGWQAQPMPIIDGEAIERLRYIANQKKKPGDPDGFAIALRAAMVDAKVRGRNEAEEAHIKTLKMTHEAYHINVVSAFISELNGVMRMNNGTMPPVMMIGGFTLVRVLSALRDAGYTEEGKDAGFRKRS